MAAIREWLTRFRESRKLILVIVAIALLLDNMLLTIVVPIIPKYLYQLSHPNDTVEEGHEIQGTPSSVPLSSSHPPLSTSLTRYLKPSSPFNYTDYLVEEAQEKLHVLDCCIFLIGNETELAFTGNEVCIEVHQTKKEKFDACKKYIEDYRTSIIHKPTPTTVSDSAVSTFISGNLHINKEDLKDENLMVGFMFSSKAWVQLITNPFIGPLTHRIGYSIPMFAGFVIMFVSTLIFAFGDSYGILFVARALQGIGSSCSSVSGMGMLADRYPDDKERGNAMGLALGGLALGVLIGPPFGGFLSEYVGKMVPFLLLAILALGDGLLQLLVLQPAVAKQEQEAPTLMELIKDPYIIIAAASITFANMGIGMLEPTLPIWMMQTMQATESIQGVAFLPASISYLIGTNLFGPLGHLMGRWLASLIGLFIIGICLCSIPAATTLRQLISPMAGLGFAIGMVDSSMMPELGYLVDIRHSAVYGSVYSIGDVAFCLGFGIGPAVAGSLVESVGFRWMLYGIGFINFLYAPVMYFLKSPPPKCEEQQRRRREGGDPGSELTRQQNDRPLNYSAINCISEDPSPNVKPLLKNSTNPFLNGVLYTKSAEEEQVSALQ